MKRNIFRDVADIFSHIFTSFGFPARFTKSRTFNLTEDELLAHMKSAFENLEWFGYEIRQGGKEFHKWLRNSPMTWGEEFTVKFLPGGVIEAQSRCASGGWRNMPQIFDFGANRQNVETFFAQVEREISTFASPQISPREK